MVHKKSLLLSCTFLKKQVNKEREKLISALRVPSLYLAEGWIMHPNFCGLLEFLYLQSP